MHDQRKGITYSYFYFLITIGMREKGCNEEIGLQVESHGILEEVDFQYWCSL